MNERTLESIKSKRKSPDYQALLDNEKAKVAAVRVPAPRRQRRIPVPVTQTREESRSLDSTIGHSFSNTNEVTQIYNWASEYLTTLDSDGLHHDSDEMLYLNSVMAISEIQPGEALDLTEKFLLRTIAVETPKASSKKWKRKRKKEQSINISGKRQRREKYAQTQKLYKKNRSTCFESIFCNAFISDKLSTDDTFDFWEHLLR